MDKFMTEGKFDYGIIGAGPAGYTLGIRLAQKGKTVALFEKNFVGGACLNLGCIPTKTILHSCQIFDTLKKADKFGVFAENISADFQKIYERKNSVVEKMRKSLEKMILSYGINLIYGEAEIKSSKEIECNGKIYEVDKIVVATGSEPLKFDFGDLPDGLILNSNDILSLEELPKSIVIIGSGAIGLEWSRILSSLGVEVHLVELAEKLLPVADFEVSQRVDRILKRSKVKIYTSNSVEKIDYLDGMAQISLKKGETIQAQKVLLAVGRKPVSPKSDILPETDKKGLTLVNSNYEAKNGVFYIGDVSSKIQLAHNAIHQALNLADYLCEGALSENYAVPSVIYGAPEIAWVGQTEQGLIVQNKEYKKSMYPVSALGKAQADGEIEGFVKLLSVDGVLVGAHIISPEASSLICEFLLPVQKGLKVSDLAKICHPHPTYSEASFEAVLGLNDMPLSVMKGV